MLPQKLYVFWINLFGKNSGYALLFFSQEPMDRWCAAIAIQLSTSIFVIVGLARQAWGASSFGARGGQEAQMRRHIVGSLFTIIAGVAALERGATAVVFDPSFGTFGASVIRVPNSGDHGGVVHRLADGRIVVAGVSSPTGSSNLGVLAVFNPNGTLDQSFAGGGVLKSSSIDGFYSLNSDASGRILVAGTGGANQQQFAIQRLHPNGTIETTLSSVDFGSGHDYPHELTLGSDGKVVAVGVATFGFSSDQGDIAVARYSAAGILQWKRMEDFEQSGYASTFDWARTAAIQPDGKILVGGGGGGVNGNDWVGGFHLLRYNEDGSRDASFGANGFVHTPFVSQFEGPNLATIYDLRVFSDGKILATGRSSRGALMLVKYNSDGTLVSDFGNGGVALAADDPRGIQLDNISEIALREDGAIRVIWLGDNILYEGVVSGMGQTLSLERYSIPHLPIGDLNFQEYNQALLLEDGDLLAVGRAAPERYSGQAGWIYTTDLLIARFDADFTKVPEPSAILLLLGACAFVSRRLGAPAHRRGRR
jgi:uncharacterized delta-60 repeat protein